MARRRKLPFSFLLALATLTCGGLAPGFAQEPETEEAIEETATEPQELPPTAVLEVAPTELTLEVGEKATIVATLKDGDTVIEGRKILFFSRARRSVGVNPAGEVEAYKPGEFTVIALVPKDPEERPRRAEALLKVEVTVTIPNPPVESVEVVGLPANLYADSILPLTTLVTDTSGAVRQDVEVSFETDRPDIARPDGFGNLSLAAAGSVTLTAHAEDASHAVSIEVRPSRVARFELRSAAEQARTGDVVRFTAVGLSDSGEEVPDLPVQYTVSGIPAPTVIAAGAPALIEPDGSFVAERSGVYTVVAVSGSHSASRRIKIGPRKVTQRFELVGHAPVRDRHTSDLWIWEGRDGRDYAITGTWGAEGHAYIWDVTNPENMVLIDTVRVDARTVNDVKLTEDGKVAVITREGASNRKNGFVILDVAEPAVGVRILARYDDQLKGGVHNVFVHENHVYAVNNSRRFDVINIEDPTQPHRVGRFELDTPGHAIHDVWVVDGVAFSSNWGDGVVAIDVGGGGKGGAPNNPVLLGSYAHPSGWNHAAFPYRSKSTGKFYVFAGDEAFPYGELPRVKGGAPPRAAGWIHVIEWDDWERPREVARYQVPEAGTHNLWIEDDVLYVGYYNGGLRAVDISGELRGDLYRQGREMAMILPTDPQGYVPNAPFTWGPQPFKGHIFFSDWNSGLWAVKMTPLEDPDKVIGEPQ